MQRSVSIVSVLLFCFALAFGFLPTTSGALGNPILIQENIDSADLISTLDDCIQKRFLDVDLGFGFRRLTRSGDTPHRFKAENAKELSVVGYLSKVKLDVILYLGGRNMLEPRTEASDINHNAGKLIKGPVFITDSDRRVTGSPTTLELMEHGQKAMRVFQKSDTYNFAIREWKIIARPVRASDASCLKCHYSDEINIFPETKVGQESRRLKIGDPLGVVLYAYSSGQ
jgi:hypothetical protein